MTVFKTFSLQGVSRSCAWCVLGAAMLLTGGCATAPPEKPATVVPVRWLATSPTAVADPQAGPWWHAFHDEALNQLLARTLRQAPDQRAALARIAEARAQRQNATAQLFPLIQGVAGASRTHQPANNRAFRSGTLNQFQTGLEAAWEIDLFGRNRATADAARATERAAEADSQAVALALVAETVRNYVLYHLYQQQAHVAASNATAQSAVYRIAQARYDQGLDSQLELARAQTLVRSTEAEIPLYQNLAQAAAYQVDYLAGDVPGANEALINRASAIPLIQRDVFLDVPLAVMQRRPDVRAAEQRVLAATSVTRATVATLYPSLNVSAALGLAANATNGFVQSNNTSWSLGSSVLAPLFDFGRIRANITAAQAREEQVVIAYEQTVLAALRDVETAATAYRQSQTRYDRLNAAATASQKALTVARRQYQEGILSQLDVLQAEQTAYAAQQDVAQAAADMTQGFVSLCQALGLGLDLTDAAT